MVSDMWTSVDEADKHFAEAVLFQILRNEKWNMT